MAKRDGGSAQHTKGPIIGKYLHQPDILVDHLLKTPLSEIKFVKAPTKPHPSLSIEKIVVDGFGPHNGPNDLKIADGLTLLTGENGTGKTHLLLAVHWCLFGERGSLDPWMSETDPLGKDLVNWDRTKVGKRTMSVEVLFKWEGTMYKASRRIERNKKKFILKDLTNGSNVDNGTPSGLTPDILPYLIFQGEAVMFLASEDPFLKDGNLKDVIRTLSGSGEVARSVEILDQARSILVERSRSKRESSIPLEQELTSLEDRSRSIEKNLSLIKKEILNISTRKKGSLSSYKKALKELSGSGMVSREEEENAMAKAKEPILREELNSMLSGAGREVLRKMAERALDRCLKEREDRIKSRMMFGAIESQASIVRSISETGKCLCGTSIGRTGMGRENIKTLLLRLEARRDELKDLGKEPIWTSDQVLEGTRMCLAISPYDRQKMKSQIKELDKVKWVLTRDPSVEHGAMVDTLISTVREFERVSSDLERKRDELKKVEVLNNKIKRDIRKIEQEMVKLWGTKEGGERYSERLALLDEVIDDMTARSLSLMEEMRETIQDNANSTLINLDAGGKLGKIRIHPTTFRLGRELGMDDGKRILPMAYLSAGERELMALSVISSIPGISDGMLMLDSPFPYIDSTRKQRIIDGLPKISKKVFISFPDGTLDEDELRRAERIWKEHGSEFRHYKLLMEPGGSRLSEVGGAPK